MLWDDKERVNVIRIPVIGNELVVAGSGKSSLERP